MKGILSRGGGARVRLRHHTIVADWIRGTRKGKLG